MRAFVGIPVDNTIKKEIIKIQKDFDIKGIKLVEPQNLHWTVKFLGDVEDREINKIKEIMSNLKFSSFNVEIGGIGVFPSLSYIKTIWIGVLKGENAFMNLLNELNKRIENIGRRNDHKIKPHLTIGRVKFVEDREKIVALVKSLEKKNVGKMKINKISLFESILTKNGPKYNVLKEVVLK